MSEPVEEDDHALEFRNILQTVAQLRTYQKLSLKEGDSRLKERYLAECKKLENSIDIRLASAGIRAF